jgi:two-component system cell cycle sensor histidine kinase/response regulator CckA
VISNLDLALEDIRASDDAAVAVRREDLEVMLREAREGAERVRRIVQGLKTFSRNEEERRIVLELRPILELAIAMTTNEVRHRARLVMDFGAVPLVEADAVRLGQVFINLIVNAAQALPDGQSEENEIRITTSMDATGRAMIDIQDTGPGIPASIVDRLFDPFFTTKPVGVGTGLGLSISQNIVSGMGGEIRVESDARHGTTFRVVLPPASVQELARHVESSPPPDIGRARVLVVDDEPALGTAFRRILRGHDVAVVTRAREALDRLATGETFDIIFSDLMMPEMSGMDFFEEATRRFPTAAERMVFVTGGAFTPDATAFLARISNEHLEKPFDPESVRSLVRTVSHRRKIPAVSEIVELRAKEDPGARTAGTDHGHRDARHGRL